MGDKVKVAFVAWSLPHGGGEVFLLRTARYLLDHGCSVEVIVIDGPGPFFEYFTGQGIPCVRRDNIRSGHHDFDAWRLGRWLAEQRYDVLFLNWAPRAHDALPYVPDHTPIIPIIHGDSEKYYAEYAKCQRMWNAAVAVSPKIQDTLRARLPDKPILYHPIRVPMPDEADYSARMPHAQPFRVLFLGRIEHTQKQVLLLPEIVNACRALHADVRLTIAGDGPDMGELQNRIDEHGLREHIATLGNVELDNVYSLLLQSHALLLPSTWEGLPTVLMEAQSCGCVPVVSNLSGITDVGSVPGETALLVAVGDVSGYARAITLLAGESSLWQRMSMAGHLFIREHFRLDQMGDEYLHLIRRARQNAYPLHRYNRHLDQKMEARSQFLYTPLTTLESLFGGARGILRRFLKTAGT
jgi:glycosyltransferase involved in cell wall biosynthesis